VARRLQFSQHWFALLSFGTLVGGIAMNVIILSGLAAIAIMLSVVLLGGRFSILRRAYYEGIATWSGWLPALATIGISALVAINLIPGVISENSLFHLTDSLHTTELLMLVAIAPLFLTRSASLLATMTIVYLVARILTASAPGTSSLGIILLCAATTLVAALGDRMPWIAQTGTNSLASRVRGLCTTILSIGAVVAIFAALVKLPAFAKWATATFDVAITKETSAVVLLSMLGVWLTILFGITRHFSLPIVALPTLFVLAFSTGWPGYLLVIPFTAALALALTTADRRLIGVRLPDGRILVANDS